MEAEADNVEVVEVVEVVEPLTTMVEGRPLQEDVVEVLGGCFR